MQYEKPENADLGDLIVRIWQSTDRIIGRQTELIETEKKLVSKFEDALREQKISSRWAAIAAIAALLTALAMLIVAWVTYRNA
jgi:hypothetical protein